MGKKSKRREKREKRKTNAANPTTGPTPTPSPSESPSVVPTNAPTTVPTLSPSTSPSETPSDEPTTVPSVAPISNDTDNKGGGSGPATSLGHGEAMMDYLANIPIKALSEDDLQRFGQLKKDLTSQEDWFPATGYERRKVMDLLMTYYNFCLLKNEPLAGDRLFVFQMYAEIIIENVKGHYDEKIKEIWQLLQRITPQDNAELFSVTKQDKKFLWSAVKANHSSVYVALSMLALGNKKRFLEGNRHEGLNCFMDCVKTCKSATEEEKNQKLPLMFEFCTVGDFLSHVRTRAEDQIQGCSAKSREVGISIVPGGQCDCCGAFAEEDKSLLACSRCNNVYYCNTSCQKQHWKQGPPDGHKDMCRKRGEFRVGDQVTYPGAELLLILLIQKYEDNIWSDQVSLPGASLPPSLSEKFEDKKSRDQVTHPGTLLPLLLIEKYEDKTWLVGATYGNFFEVVPEAKLSAFPPCETRFSEAKDSEFYREVGVGKSLWAIHFEQDSAEARKVTKELVQEWKTVGVSYTLSLKEYVEGAADAN